MIKKKKKKKKINKKDYYIFLQWRPGILNMMDCQQFITLVVDGTYETLKDNYYLPDLPERIIKAELREMLGTIKLPKRDDFSDVLYDKILKLGCDFESCYPDMMIT